MIIEKELEIYNYKRDKFYYAENFTLKYSRKYPTLEIMDYAWLRYKMLKKDKENFKDIKIPRFNFYKDIQNMSIDFDVEYIQGITLDNLRTIEIKTLDVNEKIWKGMIERKSDWGFTDITLKNFVITENKEIYFIDLEGYTEISFDYRKFYFILNTLQFNDVSKITGIELTEWQKR